MSTAHVRSVAAWQVHQHSMRRKLVGLVALSKDLGQLGIKRLNHETMNPELQPNSVERRPKSSRRPTPNKASSTASSFAEACERGHDAEQQGRVCVVSGGCSNIHHMCWPCARFWLCIGCYFSPRGRDDRSRAPPTAARPSVCPSPDLWASFLPSLGVCLLACRVPQAALTATVASSAPIAGV